jgi:hypothetical protein
MLEIMAIDTGDIAKIFYPSNRYSAALVYVIQALKIIILAL